MSTTILISDLHLGSSGGIDLLRRPDIREKLWAALEGADQVVLLGDAVELRDRPLSAALELAQPFFDELGAAVGKGCPETTTTTCSTNGWSAGASIRRSRSSSSSAFRWRRLGRSPS